MNLVKNVWVQKIRGKSNGYSHINGILIIKFLENTEK